nr:NADH dehydrogenase subunit 4L, mitochondrial [Tanacetum cinerariifolium]
KDAGVKFLSDGKIVMDKRDLSGDPNLLKIKEYSSRFDLSSQVVAASNNIPIRDLDALVDVKKEMAALQLKIREEVEELVKQHYRIGKSVRHSIGVPVSGAHVLEASSFDSAIKVNSQIAQESLDSIFLLAERKHQLSKAIQFSPYFRSGKNKGSLSFDDILGQTYAIYIISIAGAESAIGLGILVAFYRLRGSVAIEFK